MAPPAYGRQRRPRPGYRLHLGGGASCVTSRKKTNSRAGFTFVTLFFSSYGQKPQLTRGLHYPICLFFVKFYGNPNSRAGFTPKAFFPESRSRKPQLTRGLHMETNSRDYIFRGNPNSRMGFTPVYCISTLCITQYIGAVPFLGTRTRLKGASRLKRRLPAEAGLTSPNLRDRVRPLYLSDKETISESKQKMQNYAKIFRI